MHVSKYERVSIYDPDLMAFKFDLGNFTPSDSL